MNLQAKSSLDYMVVCRKAVGAIQRSGLCERVDREDLISEGCLALSVRNPSTEALAVKVARDAMFDALRKSERRERGRVEVRSVAGIDEASEGDDWDVTVYGKQNLQPVNPHTDLWEAMKALPPRQYQAITLVYWAGKTLEVVAVEMGISFQRVSQIIQEAKINMRSALENRNSHTVTNMRGRKSFADGPVGPNGGGVGQ